MFATAFLCFLAVLAIFSCYCAPAETEMEHLVFVYGTLKTGEQNHHQLFAKGADGAVFLGRGMTNSKFPLIIHTPFNIPFLLHKEGTGNEIQGELYRVNNETLEHLDLFEGHPRWYERRQTKIKLFTDSRGYRLENPRFLLAWIYGLARFKNSLLELPLVNSYDTKNLEPDKRLKPYNPETDGSLAPYLYDD